MYNEQRLLNKKTIVTGGARGIGAGIVRRLYAEGAEIIISDFREELALDLIQELDQDKGNISFHKTDLSKEEEIIKLFKFAKDKWLVPHLNADEIEDGVYVSWQEQWGDAV